MTKIQLNQLCLQQKFSSAWTSAKSDLSLCCSHEVTENPWLMPRLTRVLAECKTHFFFFVIYTVKPVLRRHSKIDKTKDLKTDGRLMKVESIAECSHWSIL